MLLFLTLRMIYFSKLNLVDTLESENKFAFQNNTKRTTKTNHE